MSATDLNALYLEYRDAEPERREEAKNKLIRAMFQNGYAIVWHRLKGVHPHIVGDAVAQAVRYLDRFRGDSQFSTWFYEIVSNYCRAEIRNKLRRAEVSIEEFAGEGKELECTRPIENTASIDLAWLLDSLEPNERRLVELKLEGLNDKEIANRLGSAITPKGVNSRWARLRSKLANKASETRTSSIAADSARKRGSGR